MGFLLSLFLLVFLAPTLLVGCNNTEDIGGGNSVVQENRIPPIDAAAPAVTETATFALG